MNMQSTKLELIKLIADIQSEELLERIRLFLSEVENEVKASDQPPALSKEETELLLKINEGLPEEVQLRYNELLIRQAEERINETEHKELMELVPRIEAKSAERMKYLLQLAKLWGTSVDQVMERLGIKPPPVIHA